MTTNELEGRALAEAAARAMGWFLVPWVGGQGWLRPGGHIPAREPEPTEREMLAWLQMRKPRAVVATLAGTGWAEAKLVFHPDWSNYVGPVIGRDLREALARLVVAVARREEKP